jgi:hypothetical protein
LEDAWWVRAVGVEEELVEKFKEKKVTKKEMKDD